MIKKAVFVILTLFLFSGCGIAHHTLNTVEKIAAPKEKECPPSDPLIYKAISETRKNLDKTDYDIFQIVTAPKKEDIKKEEK